MRLFHMSKQSLKEILSKLERNEEITIEYNMEQEYYIIKNSKGAVIWDIKDNNHMFRD